MTFRHWFVASAYMATLHVAGHFDSTGPFLRVQPRAALESSRADLPIGILTQTFVRESTNWGKRVLNVTIWYPASEPAAAGITITDAPPSNRGTSPIIFYSHGGCGGSPQAIAPIARAIAQVEFVFVQFPHPGSTTDDCAPDGERYTSGLLERPDDIIYVLNELARSNGLASWRLHGRVDSSRVGIIGHSQGGQTALMMPAKDSRVKAALSISPSVAHRDTPKDVWSAIENANAQVMIVHGSRDAMWTSAGPLKAFNSLPSRIPRAYLEIDGMGHTPSSVDEVAIIVRYAAAFFRYYVLGDASAAAIMAIDAAPPNVSLRSSGFP